MCMMSVLPLPVAIQKASLFRSASVKSGSAGSPGDRRALRTRRSVQLPEQLAGVVEAPVQEDFCVQHRQVLEVPQGDGLRPAGVDRGKVAADVVVVPAQVGQGNAHLVPAADHVVKDETAAVGVESLVCPLHVGQQLLIVLVAEEAVQPGQEDQALLQLDVFGAVGCPGHSLKPPPNMRPLNTGSRALAPGMKLSPLTKTSSAPSVSFCAATNSLSRS